jgi:protein-disulfide isomerase
MFNLTIPVTARDHQIGPSDAAVTVVEYGDFECPNCRQAAPAIKLLLRHFENRMLFAYRHFPLQEVHPNALAAAEAAECAGAQGQFWPMHDLLFDNQQHLQPADLRKYAGQLRLDAIRYSKDLTEGAHRSRISEHIAGGRASGARSTPTIFVNGMIFDVSFGLQRLHDAVELALTQGR